MLKSSFVSERMGQEGHERGTIETGCSVCVCECACVHVCVCVCVCAWACVSVCGLTNLTSEDTKGLMGPSMSWWGW